MATNPMQRKARNSFLLGMLVTLLIAGVAIAFLLMQLMKEKAEEKTYVMVSVLSKDVESGGKITSADLISVEVPSEAAPTQGTIGPASFTVDAEGNEIAAIAKVNLKANTILTEDMIVADGEETGSDVRRQEYNSIVLPMDLVTEDYIDIRLMLPSGQDYIVVSKKQVEIPMVGGVDSTDTIIVEMSEDEILMMSNALVDAYMIEGSKLYATKYTEPGNQDASTPTYVVGNEVAQLINSDPNIVEQAKTALAERYNNNTSLRQNYINPAIQAQEDAAGNQAEKMTESITNAQSAREEYLNGLTAAPAE